MVITNTFSIMRGSYPFRTIKIRFLNLISLSIFIQLFYSKHFTSANLIKKTRKGKYFVIYSFFGI